MPQDGLAWARQELKRALRPGVQVALLILLASAVGVACGSGSDRARTIENQQDQASLLKSGLLDQADLPTGWTVLREDSTSGENVKGNCDEAIESSRKVNISFVGPVGATTKLEREGLTQQVYLFPKGEAKRFMDAQLQCIESDASGRQSAASYVPLSFPKIADQTIAVRVSVDLSGVGVKSVSGASVNQVLIRRGNVVMELIQAGINLSVNSLKLEEIARVADKKLSPVEAALP